MNLKTLAVASFAVTVSLPLPAISGNAENGKFLAKQWCATCHLIEPSQTNANDSAPPFSEIARRPDLSYLKSWLADPHPPMPSLNLTKQEIDDLISYIETLR